MEKIFLTDIDDVVLDWTSMFHSYMLSEYNIKTDTSDKFFGLKEEDFRTYTRQFNNSKNFSRFSPYRDSYEYMCKIHTEFGYSFVGITSCLTDTNKKVSDKMKEQRIYNLNTHFGDMFKDIHCLGLGQTKEYVLMGYNGVFFVDDMAYNCKAATAWVENVFHMESDANHDDIITDYPVTRVKSWKEIYLEVKKYEESN